MDRLVFDRPWKGCEYPSEDIPRQTNDCSEQTCTIRSAVQKDLGYFLRDEVVKHILHRAEQWEWVIKGNKMSAMKSREAKYFFRLETFTINVAANYWNGWWIFWKPEEVPEIMATMNTAFVLVVAIISSNSQVMFPTSSRPLKPSLKVFILNI